MPKCLAPGLVLPPGAKHVSARVEQFREEAARPGLGHNTLTVIEDYSSSAPAHHSGVMQTVPGFDRLTVEADRLGGQPCIRGYRFSG